MVSAISTSGLGVGASRASFIAVFWRPLQVTVRPMLRDHSPVCPVCNKTLVYCGQTVGYIRMPLGMKVCLSPGDIVLDGDAAPPRKGHSPSIFRPTSIMAKRPPISVTAELLLPFKLLWDI